MKEFNIDKLERKNSLATPPNFFENLQDNVLNKTTRTKTNTFALHYKWTIAAAISFIAGLALWTLTTNDNLNTEMARNTSIIDSSYSKNTDNYISKKSAEPKEKETHNNTDIVEQHTTSGSPKKTKDLLAAAQITSSMSKNKSTPMPTSESKINQVLAVFTSAQISEVEKTIDQDVYLDLYN